MSEVGFKFLHALWRKVFVFHLVFTRFNSVLGSADENEPSSVQRQEGCR
jgi:hypothetical protein